MEYRSYDDVLQEFIELRMAGDATLWAQAELAHFACDVMGAKKSQFAADVGYSERRILDYRKTYSAFPKPEERLPDQSFEIHIIAAGTNDPTFWLAEAADHGWSTREFRKAIKGETTPDSLRMAEATWAAVERELKKGGPGAELIRAKIKEKAGEILSPA